MNDRLLTRLLSIPGARSLWVRYPLGDIPTRVRFGAFDRAHYAYGVYRAAELARSLKLPAISVIELGVAGGIGLLSLERISREIAGHFAIEISVFGFDSGEGMPAASSYKDLPYVWSQGFYRMDQERLRKQLSGGELVLGDISRTLPAFTERPGLPPIGFVAFDLDYYSSTRQAFSLFDAPAATRLPRVFCYFDDIIWPESACYNEFTGELAAIREFNEEHPDRKIGALHMLRHLRPFADPWNDQIYVMHDFQHPQYCTNITPESREYRQLPL